MQIGRGGQGGSCSDGQNDPEIDYHPGPGAQAISGTSSGTHYQIMHVSGNSFTYTITPAANSTAGSCSVQVSQIVYPLMINITNTKYGQDNLDHGLIGLHETATMPSSSSQPSSFPSDLDIEIQNPVFTISNPGLTYKSAAFGTNYSSFEYVRLLGGDFSQQSINYAFANPVDSSGNAGSSLIEAQGNIYINGIPSGEFYQNVSIKVDGPLSDLTAPFTGTEGYLSGPSNQDDPSCLFPTVISTNHLRNDVSVPVPSRVGIEFAGVETLSSAFPDFGPANYYTAQTISADYDEEKLSQGNTPVINFFGSALDGVFPNFPSLPGINLNTGPNIEKDGLLGNDTPSRPIIPPPGEPYTTGWFTTLNLENFLVFQNNLGDPVPVKGLKWSWTTIPKQINSATDLWSAPDGSPIIDGTDSNPIGNFYWTQVNPS